MKNKRQLKKSAIAKKPVLDINYDWRYHTLNKVPAPSPFVMPELPHGVAVDSIAMDNDILQTYMNNRTLEHMLASSNGMIANRFKGYQHLAALAQNAEYRIPSQAIADEATSKWIKIVSNSKAASKGQDKKIDAINKWLNDFNVKAVINQALLNDGLYGCGHIYFDTGCLPEKRQNPLLINANNSEIKNLKALRVIEPMWITAYDYNTTDPTKADFFKPRMWHIVATATHHTRLRQIITRPISDSIKPFYNFGGVSLTQLLEPYVNNFVKIRDSGATGVTNYSKLGLKTNLSDPLSGGSWKATEDRAAAYTATAENGDMLILDKDTEDMFMLNMPLTGVDELQKQALEMVAYPARMPIVKMLGQTPGGLNASSDEEMDCWYENIYTVQENKVRPLLKDIIDIAQLQLFGAIDETIGFRFEPLKQMSELDKANINKIKADTGAVLANNTGAITNDEERDRLKADEFSGYDGLTGGAPEPELDDDSDNKTVGDWLAVDADSDGQNNNKNL